MGNAPGRSWVWGASGSEGTGKLTLGLADLSLLLEPELPKYREEFRGLAKSDEDVLSLALFPQVAPKFLSWRDGPREAPKPEPPKPAAQAAPPNPADPSAVRELYVEYKF